MKTFLTLLLCASFSCALAQTDPRLNALDGALKAALQPVDSSEFWLNPLLSLRVKVSYENGDTMESSAVVCSALVSTAETVLVADAPCAEFLREKTAALREQDTLIILADFGNFGSYQTGEFKGYPFFYRGTVTPDKLRFSPTGKYALVWTPVSSRRLTQKLSKLSYPETPQDAELDRIFRRLPKAEYLQYVNPYTIVMYNKGEQRPRTFMGPLPYRP